MKVRYLNRCIEFIFRLELILQVKQTRKQKIDWIKKKFDRNEWKIKALLKTSKILSGLLQYSKSKNGNSHVPSRCVWKGYWKYTNFHIILTVKIERVIKTKLSKFNAINIENFAVPWWIRASMPHDPSI